MSRIHVFLVCDPKPGSIFVSSTRFLWIWRAGVTHLPQEHCSPHQLKEPSLALHLGQRSWNKAHVSWQSFAFLQKNYPWQQRIERRNTAATFKNFWSTHETEWQFPAPDGGLWQVRSTLYLAGSGGAAWFQHNGRKVSVSQETRFHGCGLYVGF